MGRYAEGTSVPVARTKQHIESELERFGADSFISGWDGDRAMVSFRYEGWVVRFTIEVPEDEREERRIWRCLFAGLKAKLVMVADGVVQFEEEFLPHVVLPNNQTVAEQALPQIRKGLASGEPLKLLPEKL